MGRCSTNPRVAGVGKLADGKGVRTCRERETAPWHKINVLWLTGGQPTVLVYLEAEVIKPASG